MSRCLQRATMMWCRSSTWWRALSRSGVRDGQRLVRGYRATIPKWPNQPTFQVGKWSFTLSWQVETCWNHGFWSRLVRVDSAILKPNCWTQPEQEMQRKKLWLCCLQRGNGYPTRRHFSFIRVRKTLLAASSPGVCQIAGKSWERMADS